MPVILYLPEITKIYWDLIIKHQGKLKIFSKNLDFIETKMDDVKYSRQYQDFLGM